MPLHQRNIKVDDELILKCIPNMRRIGKSLIYCDHNGTPMKGKDGRYVLSWSVVVYNDRQRLLPIRAMTTEEVVAITKAMAGTYAIRDRAWFLLGTYCGLRPRQLSALTVADIFDFNGIKSTFTVPLLRRRVRQERLEKEMHPIAGAALGRWLQALQKAFGRLRDDYPLFDSRKSNDDGTHKNPERQTYWYIFHQALQDAQIELANEQGRLCLESMHKTYMAWAHDAYGYDLLAIAACTGHTNPDTTARALRLSVMRPEARLLAYGPQEKTGSTS